MERQSHVEQDRLFFTLFGHNSFQLLLILILFVLIVLAYQTRPSLSFLFAIEVKPQGTSLKIASLQQMNRDRTLYKIESTVLWRCHVAD